MRFRDKLETIKTIRQGLREMVDEGLIGKGHYLNIIHRIHEAGLTPEDTTIDGLLALLNDGESAYAACAEMELLDEHINTRTTTPRTTDDSLD